MIPWTEKEDLDVFHGEYSQATVTNRTMNRLLDNDRNLDERMDSISLTAENITYASESEVQSLETSGKVIRPGTIMSLSATPADIESGGDTRFVTANGHVNKMNGLSTGVSYIDLFHLGVFSKWPTAEYISSQAQYILGNYTPLIDTKIDVLFAFDQATTITSSSGFSSRSTTRTAGETKLARYRYNATGLSNDWTYIGRLVNETGRLNQ